MRNKHRVLLFHQRFDMCFQCRALVVRENFLNHGRRLDYGFDCNGEYKTHRCKKGLSAEKTSIAGCSGCYHLLVLGFSGA